MLRQWYILVPCSKLLEVQGPQPGGSEAGIWAKSESGVAISQSEIIGRAEQFSFRAL